MQLNNVDRSLAAPAICLFLGLTASVPAAFGQNPQLEFAAGGGPENFSFASAFDLSPDFVAIGGRDAVVGTQNDGVVWVYSRTTGQLLYRLTSPAGSSAEDFGQSVEIVQGTLAVGDPQQSGVDRVYMYDLATGIMTAELLADPSDRGFGHSLDSSGSRLAVGAPFTQGGGSVSVFNVSNLTLEARFTNPTQLGNTRFGESVSIDGDKVLITTINHTGVAYLHDLASPGMVTEIFSPFPAGNSFFGVHGVLSGDRVAISAPSASQPVSASGVVHVFSALTGDFERSLTLAQPQPFDRLGWALDMNGSLVAATTIASRSVVYFDVDSGQQILTQEGPDDDPFDFFALAMAMDETGVIVSDQRGSTAGNRALLYRRPTRAGTSFCGPAAPNSTGHAGELVAIGSQVPGDNDITLVATSLPGLVNGYFLASTTAGMSMLPFSAGTLCLSGSIGRYAASTFQTTPFGSTQMTLDLEAIPSPTGARSVLAGETWRFQAWYRDFTGIGFSNLTDAVAIPFQ